LVDVPCSTLDFLFSTASIRYCRQSICDYVGNIKTMLYFVCSVLVKMPFIYFSIIIIMCTPGQTQLLQPLQKMKGNIKAFQYYILSL